MKKKMNEGAAFDRVNHILKASGNATPVSLAEAILTDVYDRVEPVIAERMVKWVISAFDISNPDMDRKYSFPDEWDIDRWNSAGGDEFSAHCKEHCNSIIKESGGHVEFATRMIMGVLKHLDGDERIMFFTSVMVDGICPFNFHVSMEGLDINKINEIALSNRNFRDLFALISGEGRKRFLSPVDRSDYIVTLMENLPRRELIAFMMMMEFWSKQAGAQKRVRIPGMPASLATLMNAIASAHSFGPFGDIDELFAGGHPC